MRETVGYVVWGLELDYTVTLVLGAESGNYEIIMDRPVARKLFHTQTHPKPERFS